MFPYNYNYGYLLISPQGTTSKKQQTLRLLFNKIKKTNLRLKSRF